MSSLRPQSAVASQDITSNLGFHLDLPGTTPILSGRNTSPRPATAGLTTARSSISSLTPRTSAPTATDTGPHRDAVLYFDSFKKEELREFIAQNTASWLLAPDFRGQAGLPCGLVSNLFLSQEPHITLLFPKEDGVSDLEYRELHQIVRELASGIFGGSQMPSLCLEPNFDLSTTCQLPLVYKDTRVGQILLSVDYAMKSLWHGAHVAKSKRSKLAERWRALLDVNLATGECNTTKNYISDFNTAGQEYVTSNETFKNLYDDLKKADPSERVAKRENQFFNAYSDYVRCIMTMHVSKSWCSPSKNVFAFDASYDVTSGVTLPDDDVISPVALQRLRRRLRHHMKIIQKGLLLDPETRRNIALLKFISATSLVLVALRRRLMRIPDVSGLLSRLHGDTLRTDSELPPFAIGQLGDHPCETFTIDRSGERRKLTHCHGEIQFDVDTDDISSFPDEAWCQEVQLNAINHLRQVMEDRPRSEYKVPTEMFEGQEHYVLHIPLSTFHPATPPLPSWLHARFQLLSSLRPRRLPMSDLQLAEMFKQVFGFRKALANKSVEASLRLCSCRGLVAPFIALMKKTASSSLLSPDLQGMTLLHHACIHNRQKVLSVLLNQKPNLNVRRTQIDPQSTGPTALLLACRCGALECVTALLASRAIPVLSDCRGWSAIHHAAAADQTPILRSLLRRQPNLLEIPATGGDNATPMLVAASSGALSALQFLIRKGGNVLASDTYDDGLIQRASLNFHTDILEYLASIGERAHLIKDADGLKVWPALVEMLKSSSVMRQDASLRCLEVLLHRNSACWRPLKDAGVVDPLVKLLQSNKRRPKSAVYPQDAGRCDVTAEDISPTIRSLACSVMCLMSEQDEVRKEVAKAGAIPMLIDLLRPTKLASKSHKNISDEVPESKNEKFELQSRSSVVLSDLARMNGNAERIADHGGIRPLVALLQIDVVDVLVNAVTTLASLCRGDTSGAGDIQRRIMECSAAGFLVNFLHIRDDDLQASTADAVAAICDENEENQNEFVNIGVLRPLVAILRGHCISAQLKAALAVDSITKDNPQTQREASLEGAPDSLCRLFQIWSDTVKERGACALWALAGSHPEQQRAIAQKIGTKQIMDMLLSKSDTLQLIGCKAVAAWSRNRSSGQGKLIEARTVASLIRLLRLERTSRHVVLAVIDAVNSLCIGVAHVNNKNSQVEIAEEGAIELLLDRIWKTSRDECMQVELIHCLACVVTGCQGNEEKLNELGSFGFEIVMELLNSVDIFVKFRASTALALFAFNRLLQQQKMAKVGGVDHIAFEQLAKSKDEKIQAGAAFQMVILARVLSHTSIVDASARGIIALASLLDSEEDDVIIITASYLASLAHTRAGIPDAIVTFGAVTKLLMHLRSSNDQVRCAAAQALGYLSFNRTASRELMSACRAEEGVYESLMENLSEDGKISDEFVAEFKRQSTIGLPIPKQRPVRPQTAKVMKSNLKLIKNTRRPRSVASGRKVLVATEEIQRDCIS